MRKCSKCDEIKDDSFFYFRNSKPTGNCKPCLGIKMKVDGFRFCKKCNTDKPYDNFYERFYNGKKSPTGYCKQCMNIKKFNNKTKPHINKDRLVVDKTIIREYIRRVIMRDYGINPIDFWKIIHYHQLLWPIYKEDNTIPIVDEIKEKWDDLERWYNV